MPLLQPPAPDLRASDLTYTDAYNSIVSRVRRSGGSGSGGVVILCGVDTVSVGTEFDMQNDDLLGWSTGSSNTVVAIPARRRALSSDTDRWLRRARSQTGRDCQLGRIAHGYRTFARIATTPCDILQLAAILPFTHHRRSSAMESRKPVRDRFRRGRRREWQNMGVGRR